MSLRVLVALLATVGTVLTLIADVKAANLTVDVGYAIYEGHQEGEFDAWLGMPYAAPPVGDLRWRAPATPARNRSSVMQASAYGPACPQYPQSPLTPGFAYQGDEDCLYLSVWAPTGAHNLPVMFYIHGGGYAAGDGKTNVSALPLAQATNNSFVAVIIQYRLGAFGFLASPEIESNGSLNAGILDQHLALEWTHKHISKFGGDPSRVTLVGQSAGAGSIMLQAMAYGGEEGTKYFEQVIASSPYTPAQYHYSDHVPIHRYRRFAKQAGCEGSGHDSLECLRLADTDVLQKANAVVGAGVNYGSFGFVPVTDDSFVRKRPSQQLPTGKLNGKRILTSINANEGAQFVNANISTEADFNRWLRTEYPLLTGHDIHEINTVYYRPEDVRSTRYATCGDCGGATAVNVGSFAVSPQERALNLYSEVTFDCHSYWLGQGMTKVAEGAGYKYQLSVIPSTHGFDLGADGLGDCPNIFTPQFSTNMCLAIKTVWADMIVSGNPSIPAAIANGNASTNPNASNPASDWPLFQASGAKAWQMLNFNQSGGVLLTNVGPLIAGLPAISEYAEPVLMNNISQVNAYSWKGGRGARCDF